MNHANKIFRVAVDVIMNGSCFPSGRKGVICTAINIGDIAIIYTIMVRTVSYGPSFFPLIYGPSAKRSDHKS